MKGGGGRFPEFEGRPAGMVGREGGVGGTINNPDWVEEVGVVDGILVVRVEGVDLGIEMGRLREVWLTTWLRDKGRFGCWWGRNGKGRSCDDETGGRIGGGSWLDIEKVEEGGTEDGTSKEEVTGEVEGVEVCGEVDNFEDWPTFDCGGVGEEDEEEGEDASEWWGGNRGKDGWSGWGGGSACVGGGTELPWLREGAGSSQGDSIGKRRKNNTKKNRRELKQKKGTIKWSQTKSRK